jgi:hypothetical protein
MHELDGWSVVKFRRAEIDTAKKKGGTKKKKESKEKEKKAKARK